MCCLDSDKVVMRNTSSRSRMHKKRKNQFCGKPQNGIVSEASEAQVVQFDDIK